MVHNSLSVDCVICVDFITMLAVCWFNYDTCAVLIESRCLRCVDLTIWLLTICCWCWLICVATSAPAPLISPQLTPLVLVVSLSLTLLHTLRALCRLHLCSKKHNSLSVAKHTVMCGFRLCAELCAVCSWRITVSRSS